MIKDKKYFVESKINFGFFLKKIEINLFKFKIFQYSKRLKILVLILAYK